MSDRSRGEQGTTVASKLAKLAEGGFLNIKQWGKARSGKKTDQPWDEKDRAGIVPVFMEKLKGSTTVYAVYKENPTVSHPAEEGDHFTVDEYDLMGDEIPMPGGDSQLFAVFASKEEADEYAKSE